MGQKPWSEMTQEEQLDFYVDETLAGLEEVLPADYLAQVRCEVAMLYHGHPIMRARLLEQNEHAADDGSGTRPVHLQVRAQITKPLKKKKA